MLSGDSSHEHLLRLVHGSLRDSIGYIFDIFFDGLGGYVAARVAVRDTRVNSLAAVSGNADVSPCAAIVGFFGYLVVKICCSLTKSRREIGE